MPLMSSRATASVRAFGLTVLSALSSVIDTFNRSNNPSGLGSIRGQKWKIWRGVWEILNNKASSSSATSAYALATLKFTKKNVSISVVGPDPGMGTAFWVSDANNWYAATYEQTQTCDTCQGCSAYSITCCAGTTTPGTCANYTTVSGCAAWGTQGNTTLCLGWSRGGNTCIPKTSPPVGFCSGSYNPYNNATCSGGWSPISFTKVCNSPTVSYSCSQSFAPTFTCNQPCSTCNSFFTFSCNCVVGHRVNIFRNIASSIANVANSSFTATIAAFRAIVTGNNITIRAFSNTEMTSQIGSDWNVPVTATTNAQHGIIKSSSPYAQGNAIDEFRVS